MFKGSCLRAGLAITVAIGLLGVAACSGSNGGSSSGPTTVPNADAGRAKTTLVGPVLTRDESPTLSSVRDGGISVPLPNGTDFWVFADTPRYEYQDGKWRFTGFVYGSSASATSYTPGQMPTAPLDEIVLGHQLTASNQASQLLPLPRLYLPDGSGRDCTKANGGVSTYEARWPTGAALLPDKTNILIPYNEVCVTSTTVYQVEGWGFAEYDWKANKLSVPPVDVFPAVKTGAAIPASKFFGSPVVAGNTVTFFSTTCCAPGSAYTTTIAANVAALKDPASYVPQPVLGLPATFTLSVAPPSPSQPHLTMYWADGTRGGYRIFTATDPSGPWSQTAAGTLPRCSTSPAPCNSVYIHSELSSSSQLVVSYYLPGYGPGIAAHPYPHAPLDHVVWASIPA
jgi:hypothetical protein